MAYRTPVPALLLACALVGCGTAPPPGAAASAPSAPAATSDTATTRATGAGGGSASATPILAPATLSPGQTITARQLQGMVNRGRAAASSYEMVLTTTSSAAGTSSTTTTTTMVDRRDPAAVRQHVVVREGTVTTELITIGDTGYALDPASGKWLQERLDPALVTNLAGIADSAYVTAASVVFVGVDGRGRRFRAELDPGLMLGGAASGKASPVDFWFDDRDRLVRVEQVLDAAGVATSQTTTYGRFGEDFGIEAPKIG